MRGRKPKTLSVSWLQGSEGWRKELKGGRNKHLLFLSAGFFDREVKL